MDLKLDGLSIGVICNVSDGFCSDIVCFSIDKVLFYGKWSVGFGCVFMVYDLVV